MRRVLPFAPVAARACAGFFLAMLVPLSAHAASPREAAKVRRAISRAVSFLERSQETDGAFLVERCPDRSLRQCEADRSPATAWVVSAHPTAVVLSGLAGAPDPRAAAIIKKGSRFLLAQMDAHGLFGAYRFRDPAVGPQCPGEFRQLDLTATNRAFLETVGLPMPSVDEALARYERSDGLFFPFALAPDDVAAITAGGRAREQFAQEHSDLMRDYGPLMLELMAVVDPVVNAQMFDYLVTHGRQPSSLCQYLSRVASAEWEESSSWFVESPYQFLNDASRAYHRGAACLEPVKTAWEPRLLRRERRDGSWGSALETALAAGSLLQFDWRESAAVVRAVRYLLKTQRADGSWEPAVWRRLKGHPFWFASAPVSTGVVLGTLGAYLRLIEASESPPAGAGGG